MNSSLHSLAHDMEQPDLGAFLYSLRRLPASIWQATRDRRRPGVGGVRARRHRADRGLGGRRGARPAAPLVRLRARARWRCCWPRRRDLDDAIPTLVAYQLEWNKLHALLRAAELPEDPEPLDVADAIGGTEEDWTRVRESWPDGLAGFVDEVRDRKLNLRLRMLGGSQSGYARLTRRWWAPVRATLTDQGLSDRPMYFVSSNTHSLVNLRDHEGGRERGRDRRLRRVARPRLPASRSSSASAAAATEGSWENFLYYGARLFYEAQPEDGPAWERRRKHERELGVTHLSSRTGLRGQHAGDGARQARPGGAGLAARPDRRARSSRTRRGVVVNIEYPLGLAAYNILREITTAHDTLRGVYVLGKAATLNADVGDVLISGVIHDEHSGSTYWLDNAF